jgi:heme A synthase
MCSARTVSVAVIGGPGAAAIPLAIGPLPLASMLGGLMMAYDAPCTGPEQPMMPDIMPGDTADDRALQAALGRRRSGTQRYPRNRHGKSRGEQYRFHMKLLQMHCFR